MRKPLAILIAIIMAVGAAVALAQQQTQMEDDSHGVPTADEFLSDYFGTVVNVEVGTAGSSLKQAIAARDVARFALAHDLRDANREQASGSMRVAWQAMPEADRAIFDDNLQDIFAPLIGSAFDSYDAVAEVFEDAGVGEDMALLSASAEARVCWEALLSLTAEMKDDEINQ